MEAFRQFLKGWLGKLLLFIFLAPLAFLGIESYFSTRANSDALVTIGDKQISRQEFNRAYIPAREQQLASLQGDASLLDEAELKKAVLDSLVDRAVLEEKAKEYKLYPGEAQISATLMNDPTFQEDGKFSQAKFERLLKQNGIDKRHVFADMSKQMALQQMVQLVSNTGFVTETAQNRLFDLQSAERQVWLHRIDSSSFSDKVNVTEQQIADYFSKHKADFKTKRMVDLSYISLDKDTLTVAEPTQGDLDIAYNEYVQQLKSSKNSEQRKVSHILLTGETAQQDADKVLAELKAGKKFAELAKQYSKDDSSKENGGELEFFTKDNNAQDENFIKTIFELKQVGDTSQVVKTQYGYHIIKLDEIKKVDIPSKASMTTELTNNIAMQKREEAYQTLIKKINDMAVDGVALADIAADTGAQLLQAKDFEDKLINVATLQGHAELNHPDVKKQIFDEFNISEQTPSVGVNVNDTQTVWVQPSNFRPVRDKKLAESSLEIRGILSSEQAQTFAKQEADKLANMVNAAPEHKYDIEANEQFDNVGKINRQAPMLSPQEVTGAFSVQLPKQKEASAIIAKAVPTDSGYSIVAVQAIPESEKMQTPKQIKQQMAGVMMQMAGQNSFRDYMKYLKSQAKIERNEKLIEEVMTGKPAEAM